MIKALVIDDEKAFTDIVVEFLSGLCQDVRVAPTAEAGLDLLKLILPDLVIVDNQLPDFKGVELVKHIRSVADAYIVMITIDKESEIRAALGESSVDRFLKKPFRRSDLEEVLLGAIRTIKKKKGFG